MMTCGMEHGNRSLKVFDYEESDGPHCKHGPAHDKTYNKTCEISEDSDQPARPHQPAD